MSKARRAGALEMTRDEAIDHCRATLIEIVKRELDQDRSPMTAHFKGQVTALMIMYDITEEELNADRTEDGDGDHPDREPA